MTIMVNPLNAGWDPWQLAWLWRRPERDWTPCPHEGDTVYLRPNMGEPLVTVEVVEVMPAAPEHHPTLGFDPHEFYALRHPETGMPLTSTPPYPHAPLADPWVSLLLRLPSRSQVAAREARLPGAPGWLPLDHESRWYPHAHDAPDSPDHPHWPRSAPA